MRRPRTSRATDGPREANVSYTSGLFENEIVQRNGRKDALESNARGVIAAAGTVLTLLIGLNATGSAAPLAAQITLLAALVLDVAAIAFSIAALWPRRHDRLGPEALDKFNDPEFLDLPNDQVVGQTNAARRTVIQSLDDRHASKVTAFKISLGLLGAAFVALLGQGTILTALAIHHPSDDSNRPVRVLEYKDSSS